MKSILKIYKEYLQMRNITITEGTVMSLVSKAKAKGLQPVDILNDAWKDAPRKGKAKTKVDLTIDEDELNGDLDGLTTPQVIDYLVGQIYARYERILQDNNSLDFDDLLVYGVKLFGDNPRVVKWCKHVLVDELYVHYLLELVLGLNLAKSRHEYDAIRAHASSCFCESLCDDRRRPGSIECVRETSRFFITQTLAVYGWRSAEVGNLAKMRIGEK